MFVELPFSYLKNLIERSNTRFDISECIGAAMFARHFDLITDDEELMLDQEYIKIDNKNNNKIL